MKKIKDEIVGSKKEIKKMIKEVIREEMGNFKQDLEVLKKMIQGEVYGSNRRYTKKL